MINIRKNLLELKQRISLCEKNYGKKPGSVLLLAVSKEQSVEKIALAIESGQRAFGENYLQEALPKIEMFSSKHIEWHFIGPIQSNKTKKITQHFNWAHSVDSKNIAKRLNDQRPQALPPLNICLQVNISNEKTKSGVLFDDVLPLAEYCRSLPSLKLRGLMAIPAPKKHFIEQRAECYKLKLLNEMLLKKGFMVDTLSIGMSNDWEAAIAEDATIVRIGTAIFGKRDL